MLGTGDVIVQRQDTENGFRWLISRESLDVKIEQEKAFEARTDDGQSGVDLSEPVPTGANLFEQVATGAHVFAPVHVNDQTTVPAQLHSHPSEPVRTGSHISKPQLNAALVDNAEIVDLLKKQLERAERQLDVKDKQIEALLERDRETNVLIQGLQTSLTGVVNALPTPTREASHDLYRQPAPQHEQHIRDA